MTTTKAPAVPVLTLRPFSGAELRRELDGARAAGAVAPLAGGRPAAGAAVVIAVVHHWPMLAPLMFVVGFALRRRPS